MTIYAINFSLMRKHAKVGSFTVDDNVETPNLENTQWEVKHKCCCCGPYVDLYVPNNGTRHFLRYWECQPTVPIAVTVLVFFGLFVFFYAVEPYEYSIILQIISPFPVIISLILFLWSYYGAVCMDPGFLPYNWIQTQRFYYTWQEQLSGLAVTKQQIEFAKTDENRPPHCSFSTTYGRYVIRADHICGWINNWVGKRNHKQFLLFNLYGFVYCFLLFGFNFAVKENFFSRKMTFLFLQILSAAMEVAFGLLMICFFIQTLCDLSQNRTKIQKMRGEKGDSSYSCNDSMQEICGNGSKCLWLCPTPAFDENLVINDDMPPIVDQDVSND